MSYSSEEILDALKHVKHPENGNDVVQLGMIDELEIKGKKVSFYLCFNKPNDSFKKSMQRACIQAIQMYVDEKAEVQCEIKTEEPQKPAKKSLLPKVINIVAIASGKGGVGKSTVSVNIAIIGKSFALIASELDKQVQKRNTVKSATQKVEMKS